MVNSLVFGKHIPTATEVAIKFIEKLQKYQITYLGLRAEAELLTHLRHPHIQELVEFFEND